MGETRLEMGRRPLEQRKMRKLKQVKTRLQKEQGRLELKKTRLQVGLRPLEQRKMRLKTGLKTRPKLLKRRKPEKRRLRRKKATLPRIQLKQPMERTRR